jgi:hypothetical protein
MLHFLYLTNSQAVLNHGLGNLKKRTTRVVKIENKGQEANTE